MYERTKNEKDILYILEHLKPEDQHEAKIQKGDNFKEIILKEIMDNRTRTYLGCKKQMILRSVWVDILIQMKKGLE